MHKNRLLAQLPCKDYQQLLTSGDEVELSMGDTLWEPQQRIQHIYFPLDCFISQRVPITSHENLELALVGNEGMLGVPLVLGANTSTLQALLQSSGGALRMNITSFRRELERSSALRQQLNRYVHVVLAQLALTAACISFHSIDLRLACQLLMTHDRAGRSTFHLTHEVLAQILGVRRVGVTIAAGILQKRGFVSYSRGEISILNRAGLENASCTCYQASKAVYANMFG